MKDIEKDLCRRIQEALDEEKRRTLGRIVRLTAPWNRYKGRRARIEGVIFNPGFGPSCPPGGFLYACMVLRIKDDPDKVLNSDAHSRSYLRATDFCFVEEDT